ncbi:MAG: N-acetyltransferase [Actinobacteria bacterium]|nr:N-acetyltransferase [Actinomycetota bacterium]
MLEIRPEQPRDRDAALAVERLAFGSDEESRIVDAVRDEPGSFALVAEQDGAILAHVQFSRAWIGETPVVALGPVGVRPEHQGRGIGSRLIRAGLEEARSRGEAAVILLGSPAFYPRFGFEPGSGLGLSNPFAGVRPDGFEIAEEDFMVTVFTDGVLAGEVRWHPSFGTPVEGTAGGA